jgi:hypothetical protein
MSEGIRVLVCGGRDFTGTAAVYRSLDALLREYGTVTVIEGGARGADAIAAAWVSNPGNPGTVEHEQYPAEWDLLGYAAGPIRNQEMLDVGKPDLVLAFPGGRGTADMVRRARKAGVEVIESPALPPDDVPDEKEGE